MPQEKKSGIPNTFKGSVPEFGAVLRTKYKNYKEIFQNFHDCVLQYVVVNYNKGVDRMSLIMKLEEVDLSSKEPTAPTGTRNRAPTELSKKRYELELEIHLDKVDILRQINQDKIGHKSAGVSHKAVVSAQ